MQTIQKKDLKRGNWLFLGNQTQNSKTYIQHRMILFDYRKSPLCAEHLQWYSQQRNPFSIIPCQITSLSPLTVKFSEHKKPIWLKDISHVFQSHTDFIVWRDDYLKNERIEIRDLHREIKADKVFWRARRDELRHWKRIDDLNKIQRIG